uniref:Uncharacterized protein n=1 Tax=Oryza nivara TaxID=4536 RepID=A0A0E0FMT9_ORYNI
MDTAPSAVLTWRTGGLFLTRSDIDHFCACGYLDGGSKSNGSRRRRREPDAAVVFAPPLGYRLRQQLHFRRQALGGWGEKAGAARRCRGSAGQRRRRWRRWVVAEAAGRRSQCGCGLEQDEDGGGRGGDSFGGDGGRRC